MVTNESGEKKLANTVPYTSIMTHTKEVKRTVSDILGQVESKGPTYSELLDGFSVLTGQLNTLSKTVANEKATKALHYSTNSEQNSDKCSSLVESYPLV
ncbi:hypothetical protein LOD99_61 [Oopsacas minuta]|uniref:BLOC-1-related complex subunit 7 n=1 Tax=Oopsacas minuta TaxID=111878 RepID=A0AAV7K7X7_9METZ|nr:hypothetical protein LOD99_61 [Oopsacas minuta]